MSADVHRLTAKVLNACSRSEEARLRDGVFDVVATLVRTELAEAWQDGYDEGQDQRHCNNPYREEERKG